MIAIEEDVIDTLKQRIVAEYREMPGLALTVRQAQRLWGCDPTLCRLVTDQLIREGILRWSREGLLIRRP